MGQVISTCRVSSSQRAFLEMTLEDVRAGECVLAQVTHVWTITGICAALELDCRMEDEIRTSEQVTLQVLRVQIRLVTMWARILAIGILLRYHALRCGAGTLSWRVWPTWRARQYSTSSLRAHDVSRLLLILHE